MEERFLYLIKETLDIQDRDLHLTDNFREFKEWDSLASLSLVAMLDEEFGVVINSQRLMQMNSLQDLFYAIQES
jgi:acyl carrier protein